MPLGWAQGGLLLLLLLSKNDQSIDPTMWNTLPKWNGQTMPVPRQLTKAPALAAGMLAAGMAIAMEGETPQQTSHNPW